MDIRDFLEFTPVASFILVITLISSLIAFQNQVLARKLMLNPYRMVHHKTYYEVITSGLIHADWMHLLFNMVSFYFFAMAMNPGVPLEVFMVEKAGPTGHLYFGLIYLGSMVLGDLTTIFKQKDNPSYFSLGASGAISGILFSYILFDPTSRIGVFFFPSMPAPLFALLYIAFSIFASKSRNSNINHDAHLWGGLFGFAMTVALFPGIFTQFLQEVKVLLHLA
jgi:membrane associated rhomboid family serine protease